MNKLSYLLLILFIFTACSRGEKEHELWAWSHANKDYSEEEWTALLNKMSDHHFKGILIHADSSVLVKVIPIAKKYELEVHAWMWTMNRADADPSWLSVNALGRSLADEKAYVNYYKFMCPALPEVRDFIKSKVTQLAKIDGLSGIHLDYIRYVDVFLPVGLLPKYDLVQDSIMPEFDYGYHPYLLEKYEQKYGVHPNEPEEVRNDSSWLQFRLTQVNEVVNMLPSITREHDMMLSAAVFPEPEMAAHMVRQQWDRWDIDYFFPMVYYNFYNEGPEWVGPVIKKGVEMVPDKPVVCGLYIPGIQNREDFKTAINEAICNGAKGIALFEINALKDFHWDVLKEEFP